MASTSEDDGQNFFILGLAGGVIALVIFLVVGIALHKSHAPAVGAQTGATSMVGVAPGASLDHTAPKVAEVTETVVVTVPDGASVRVENGVVKFYFASGSADIAPGAAEALAAVLKGVEGGKKAVVAGYHDDTGDAAKNAELAKRRAQTVHDVLIGLGVPASKIDLHKPAATTGTGNNAQARRVEVTLID